MSLNSIGWGATFGCAAALMLAGCGAQTQQTPEPSETGRVTELVSQLGTTRTIDRKTFLPNPTPDGLILMEWMDRRKATLNGTLRLNQLPANENPGAIKDTLAWERQTEDQEAKANVGQQEWAQGSMRRKYRCENSNQAETDWYNQTSRAHAHGGPPILVDWRAVNARFQAACDQELGNRASQRQAQAQAENDAATALESALRPCQAIYDRAYAAYIEAPTQATGQAVTAAVTAQKACSQEAQQRLAQPR